jgi:hypothetical protein
MKDVSKRQINLYLPFTNIVWLDTISTNLRISRSETVDLLLTVFKETLGKDAYEKALMKNKLQQLIEERLGITLPATKRYDYKSLG